MSEELLRAELCRMSSKPRFCFCQQAVDVRGCQHALARNALSKRSQPAALRSFANHLRIIADALPPAHQAICHAKSGKQMPPIASTWPCRIRNSPTVTRSAVWPPAMTNPIAAEDGLVSSERKIRGLQEAPRPRGSAYFPRGNGRSGDARSLERNRSRCTSCVLVLRPAVERLGIGVASIVPGICRAWGLIDPALDLFEGRAQVAFPLAVLFAVALGVSSHVPVGTNQPIHGLFHQTHSFREVTASFPSQQILQPRRAPFSSKCRELIAPAAMCLQQVILPDVAQGSAEVLVSLRRFSLWPIRRISLRRCLRRILVRRKILAQAQVQAQVQVVVSVSRFRPLLATWSPQCGLHQPYRRAFLIV